MNTDVYLATMGFILFGYSSCTMFYYNFSFFLLGGVLFAWSVRRDGGIAFNRMEYLLLTSCVS